jgi:hypothetical protein
MSNGTQSGPRIGIAWSKPLLVADKLRLELTWMSEIEHGP